MFSPFFWSKNTPVPLKQPLHVCRGKACIPPFSLRNPCSNGIINLKIANNVVAMCAFINELARYGGRTNNQIQPQKETKTWKLYLPYLVLTNSKIEGLALPPEVQLLFYPNNSCKLNCMILYHSHVREKSSRLQVAFSGYFRA